MEEKDYGVKKRTGLLMQSQVVLTVLALVLSCIGAANANGNERRMVVYVAQAVVCATVIVYALFNFKKKDIKYFKIVVIAYALLEACRAAMLHTEGIHPYVSITVRLVMIILAMDGVLLEERLDTRQSVKISAVMVLLEEILYTLFLCAFPALHSSYLLALLPFVGTLITMSIFLFNVGRLEQKESEEQSELKEAGPWGIVLGCIAIILLCVGIFTVKM